MSELTSIATEIQRKKQQGITLGDIDAIVKRLEGARSKERVDPMKMADVIAKSTASAITSSIPKPGDILGALVRANPMLSITGSILGKFKSSIESLMGQSQTEDNSSEIDKLIAEVQSLRQHDEETTESSTDELIDSKKEQWDDFTMLFDELLEIQKDIRHQLYFFNDVVTERTREESLAKLRSMDTADVPALDDTSLGSSTDELLQDIIENQQDDMRQDMALGLKGIVSSLLGGLAGMVGGFFAGGLGGILGKIGRGAAFLGKFVKIAGWIGLLYGAAEQLYEGFQGAADFFGKKDVSLFDKIRYAAVHLVSWILAPVDWILEKITGEDADLRGKFEHVLIDLQDSLIGYIVMFKDWLVEKYDWLVGTLSDMMPDIDVEAIKNMPAEAYNRMVQFFGDTWQALVDFDIPGKVKDYLSEKWNSAKGFYDGLIDTIKNFFKETVNGLLESIASTLEKNVGFGVGEELASTLRGLKMSDQPEMEKDETNGGSVSGPITQRYTPTREEMAEINAQVNGLRAPLPTAPQASNWAATNQPTQPIAPQIIAPQMNAPVTNNTTHITTKIQTFNPMGRQLVPNF